MGIKNLMHIIKKYAFESIEEKTINDYKNKVLAFDTNLLIYKNVFAIRKNGYDIMNDNISVTHIHSMLLKLIAFIKYNIKAIFVFDGQMPKIKGNTMNKRDDVRKEFNHKYNISTTEDEKKKYFYLKSDISVKEILDCKKLIKIFGFPIIQAKGEADKILAGFSKDVHIVSEDMDILLFGGSNLVRHFSIDEKKKIYEINLAILIKKLGITTQMFIDLGILLGCDYCSISTSPENALKLIKKYKSLNNMPDKYNYKNIQKYFKSNISYDVSKLDIKKINKNKLKIFLEKNKYNNDKIEKILSKIK
jgi:flap endonuclease-1